MALVMECVVSKILGGHVPYLPLVSNAYANILSEAERKVASEGK